MVKNEEQAIEATLKPFFEAGVQNYLILDTGSTDTTIATILRLFEQYNITHGYVCEKPWVDFATSRNHALEFAEELFPRALFFLMIDAEWYTHNVESLLEFCDTHRNDTETIYLCKVTNNEFTFTNFLDRLFKAHAGIRFVGKVHECPNQAATVQVPNFYICYEPSQQGQDKSHQRWFKDCNALLQDYETDPANPRTLFFLGRTYESLSDYENARFWFEKRCEIVGAKSENYMAHYKLARNYENLNNWHCALQFYLKAFSMEPKRIEPLIQITYHYVETGDYAIAYLFAKHATTISLAEQEFMFIETINYDLVRYNLLSFAAWYVGEYEIGKQATLQALMYIENHPANSLDLLQTKEMLLHNLSMYQQKLTENLS